MAKSHSSLKEQNPPARKAKGTCGLILLCESVVASVHDYDHLEWGIAVGTCVRDGGETSLQAGARNGFFSVWAGQAVCTRLGR